MVGLLFVSGLDGDDLALFGVGFIDVHAMVEFTYDVLYSSQHIVLEPFLQVLHTPRSLYLDLRNTAGFYLYLFAQLSGLQNPQLLFEERVLLITCIRPNML